MPRASWRALSRFEVPRHQIAEQRKIAAILDTLDESIRSAERLLAKLQQVRLGLLLKVFGTPTELFVLLDEVAIRGSGHTPDKSVPSYWNGGVKWVSLADSNKLDQIYIRETDKNISDLGIANSSAVKHPSGTVIVSRDAGVGKSAILADEMAVSQHFIAWRCRPSLSNMYLYYWLQYMKPRLESIAMGSTIKTIGLSYFRKLKISLPPRSKQDQDANLLLQADAAIIMQQRTLIKLRQAKHGLMDDLLTGQVRVTV